MALIMTRGRTQSLFRFLPAQTYNWQGRGGSFIGVDDVDAQSLDVPSTWLRRAMRRLLTPFVDASRRAGTDFPGLTVVERDEFELLEPKKLRGELFPKTYVCQSCDRFYTDPADTRRCRQCNGSLTQWSFVEFHRCGYISGLVPPQCRNGCHAGMRLVNRESRSFAEWAWRCARCGTTADRGVYRGCAGCRTRQVRVLRADANPVYYPQHITVVNPPTRADYAVLDSESVYRAAVAQALGALPPGLDGLRQAVNDGDTGDAIERARRQLIEDYGFEDGDPMLEEMLRRRKERAADREDWTTVVERLGLDPEVVTELGFQCAEILLAKEASPVAVDTLVDEAPTAALRALYDERYRSVLARYGFAEAVLLREFPMAFIVLGYTREANGPEEGVRFNFFRRRGGRIPMYGQRTETEAILFRLDPARVLAWLVESGVVDDPGDVDPLAWLFSVMQPVESIFEPPPDRVTASVLGLVHSVAHRTLKAVAVRSGLAVESLSEYLFPHNLAFLIYADTRSDFVLGGLEHVFRNHLADGLEKVDDERRCVFDPPCRDHTGACAFCMYLSENSCERFNSALSRWYLFGGDDGSVTWRPFWSG